MNNSCTIPIGCFTLNERILLRGKSIQSYECFRLHFCCFNLLSSSLFYASKTYAEFRIVIVRVRKINIQLQENEKNSKSWPNVRSRITESRSGLQLWVTIDAIVTAFLNPLIQIDVKNKRYKEYISKCIRCNFQIVVKQW